ncbi:MAG TPA: S26 family signal peptidase [Pirellulales bacterium]|nr:S26 family signal peptidase [Pirellulales bacterium]
MSKSPELKSRGKDAASSPRKPAAAQPSAPADRPMKDGIRETVESVVIAFVLAFLFRTFEAEAFVIPTGSMATTLRGQHKDLKCDNCGFPYLVSASEEEPNENDAQFLKTTRQAEEFQYEHEVVACVCPNCGFEMNFKVEAQAPTGRWEIVSVKQGGESDKRMNGAKLTLSEGRETLKLPSGEVETGAYTIRAGKDPRQIDLTTDGKAGTRLGIFDVDKKTLKLCLAPPDENRPAQFASAAGSEAMLIELRRLPEPPSFKGDRILVGKFAYEFNDPKRWDVAVFHYPHGAHQNYIKRLCGLSNETLVIHRGDLLTSAEDLTAGDDLGQTMLNSDQMVRMQRERTMALARKPADKVQAMLQVVYDNDFALPQAPRRWQPAAGAPRAWTSSDDGRTFETEAGDDNGRALLVYEHRLPSPADWDLMPGERSVPAQLITDSYGYNMGVIRSHRRNGPDFGKCWVSDLALDCQVNIRGDQGELVLGLVEADCLFECRINVENGDATFSSSEDREFKRDVKTRVRGPGKHRLQFANVDDQLLLWVDGKSVPFDGRFDSLARHYPGSRDLQPARFGCDGVALRVGHLRVLRDVYYRADSRELRVNEDYNEHYANLIGDRDPLRADSSGWRFDEYARGPTAAVDPRTEERWKILFGNVPAVAFRLGPDEFMMLGDNSPRSSDSRLWSDGQFGRGSEHYVKRDLLIGKALYIYWPHALDHLPYTDVWFPFFPDFARMGLVR